MANALDTGQVAGAAFDVFLTEPARENPLFGRDNVVTSPHIGRNIVRRARAISKVIPASRPKPLTLSPIIYSSGTLGTVIVAETLTVNISATDRREFTELVQLIAEQVRGDNEQPDEIRQQIAGELQAGTQILNTPKPDKNALYRYLVYPLQFIAKEFTANSVRALAAKAVEQLARWVGF